MSLPPPFGVPPRPDLGGERFPPPPAGPRTPDRQAPSPPRRSAFPVLVALLVVGALVGALVDPLLGSTTVEPSAVGAKGDYSFIHTHGGDPTRWNPCEPIHYVLGRAGLTEGGIQDVRGAIERLTDVTRVSFTYDGLTDETPSRGREPYQPDRYGSRWAPVLIAWVDPATTDISFDDDGQVVAAVATPQVANPDDDDTYVTGWIAVNADDPNPSGFRLPGMQGPVVLHELAHLLGLGHAESNGNLMEPSGGGVTSFGPGDLAGLELLSRDAGCLPSPPIP